MKEMLSFLADERELTPFAILKRKNLPKENLSIKTKTISVHLKFKVCWSVHHHHSSNKSTN
jgi:hypothetical protein